MNHKIKKYKETHHRWTTLYEQVDQVVHHGNLCLHLTRTLALFFCRLHLMGNFGTYGLKFLSRRQIVMLGRVYNEKTEVQGDNKWQRAQQVFTRFSISSSILPALGLLPDSSIFFSFSIMASTFDINCQSVNFFIWQPFSWSFSQVQKFQGAPRTYLGC